MSSDTWVCFDCRSTRRHERHQPQAKQPKCPSCGTPYVCIGHKIRIPPRTDAKAWDALRTGLALAGIRAARATEKLRATRRHALEKLIAELEERQHSSPSDERARRIRALRLEFVSQR